MRGLSYVLVLIAGGSVAGCVGDFDPNGEGPCSTEGLCLLGFECVQGFCLRCEAGGCGGLIKETIGAEGGTVVGPDQATLTVPPAALGAAIEIYIRRSNIIVPGDLEGRSLAYEIGPTDTMLGQAISVRIPISPSDPITDIDVYRSSAPGAAWTQLESTPNPAYVDATSRDLGFFVAARAR